MLLLLIIMICLPSPAWTCRYFPDTHVFNMLLVTPRNQALVLSAQKYQLRAATETATHGQTHGASFSNHMLWKQAPWFTGRKRRLMYENLHVPRAHHPSVLNTCRKCTTSTRGGWKSKQNGFEYDGRKKKGRHAMNAEIWITTKQNMLYPDQGNTKNSNQNLHLPRPHQPGFLSNCRLWNEYMQDFSGESTLWVSLGKTATQRAMRTASRKSNKSYKQNKN